MLEAAVCVPAVSELLFHPQRIDDFVIELGNVSHVTRTAIAAQFVNEAATSVAFRMRSQPEFHNAQASENRSAFNAYVMRLMAKFIVNFRIDAQNLSNEVPPAVWYAVYEPLIGGDDAHWRMQLLRLLLRKLPLETHRNETLGRFFEAATTEFWKAVDAASPLIADEALCDAITTYEATTGANRHLLKRLFAARRTPQLLRLLQDDTLLVAPFLTGSIGRSGVPFDAFYSAADAEHLLDNILVGKYAEKSDALLEAFERDAKHNEVFCRTAIVAVLALIGRLYDIGRLNAAQKAALVANDAFFVQHLRKPQTASLFKAPLFCPMPEASFDFVLWSAARQAACSRSGLYASIDARLQQAVFFCASPPQPPPPPPPNSAAQEPAAKFAARASSEKTSRSALPSRLVYERFSFEAFCARHADLLADPLFERAASFATEATDCESVDDVLTRFSHGNVPSAEVAMAFLALGIDALKQGAFMRAFSMLAAAFRFSQRKKTYIFPVQRFFFLCRTALAETAFVLVNEVSTAAAMRAAIAEMERLLEEAAIIEEFPTQSLVYCANLLNAGLVTVAVAHAKLLLVGAARLPKAQRLAKMLYHAVLCVSVFADVSLPAEFAAWQQKTVALLVTSSRFLLQTLTTAGAHLLAYFKLFLSLLQDADSHAKRFVGVFVGHLATATTADVALCFFSHFAAFFALPARSSDGCIAIRRANSRLFARVKPVVVEETEAPADAATRAEFCAAVLRLLNALHERPASAAFFASADALALAELRFLARDFGGSLRILLFFVAHNDAEGDVRHSHAPLLERIACCLWELGAFDELLLVCQLLHPRTASRFLRLLCARNLVEVHLVPFLFDVACVELLLRLFAETPAPLGPTASRIRRKLLAHLQLLEPQPPARQLAARIVKRLCTKFLLVASPCDLLDGSEFHA